MLNKWLLLCSVCLALFAGPLAAEQADELDVAIQAALAAEDRPQADRDRDRNRRPLETLKFFGLKSDSRVLELIPGGGWYTRILAPVLQDKGEFFVAVGTGRVEEGLLQQDGFAHVKVLPTIGEFKRVGRFVEGASFEAQDMDLVLTFRNLHNFTVAGRKALNDATFAALKPGGLYGVIDHTRRHMQADDDENRRRVDPVLMIKEIQAAGFELVDFSNLHYRLDDELRYEVGRRSVAGNTDRFTLLFRKPE